MATTVRSIGLKGLEGYIVGAEAQSLSGAEQISVIGLPDASIKESKDRLKGALYSVGAAVTGRHMILLLSPTEQKKNGPMADLAMAIAMLKETHQLVGDLSDRTAFLGTLSLDGAVHETEGMLAAVMQAKDLGFSSVYLPANMGGLEHIQDGSFLKPVHHLREVIEDINGVSQLSLSFQPSKVSESSPSVWTTDFSEIVGHEPAKRALMIAAAGGHHVLMSGPPGCGKSLLASAFPTILPSMTERTMIDSYSLYQLAHETRSITPVSPFRHPHHSASAVSLIGGGTIPRPGEVSLAHGGALFLDEMSEFPKKTLDMLRQPLETGKVTISRVSGTVTYPARFTMIGATNPCPCGYLGAKDKYCTCTPKQIRSYQQRLSGPILDRMDLHLTLSPVNLEGAFDKWTSADMKLKVEKARHRQYERYGKELMNSNVPYDRLLETSPLTSEVKEQLQEWSMKLHFSNRVQVNVLRTARTCADLNGEDEVSLEALKEAVGYRKARI